MTNDNLFTKSFKVGKRTYFMDIKQTKCGDKYLKISENKKVNSNTYNRHYILIFEEDIDIFREAVNTTLDQFQ